MSTILGIRVHPHTYVVGTVHARLRDGTRLGTEIGTPKYARTPHEALATLSALLRQAEHAEASGYAHVHDSREDTVNTLTAHAVLKPQAMLCLRLLIERGSLTTLEALHAGAGIRLPARVKEIRDALGQDTVETEYETLHGVRFARYHWRGTLNEQGRLDLDG